MNQHSPLISIIIVLGPNRKEAIFRCLKSITQSSYRNYEILIIDNSCIHGLLSSVKTKFPKIIGIKMPLNTGIFGYNVGFANASGEFIVVLDDDCTIDKDLLQKAVHRFNSLEKKYSAIAFNVYNPNENFYLFKHYLDLNLTDVLAFGGGAVAFRKDSLDKTGYYDTDFFCWEHEEDLAAKLIKAGYHIYFDKNILVKHWDKKKSNIEAKKIFLTFRNKSWFAIKNFSIFLFPILFARDILWFFSISALQNRSLKALFFVLTGTFVGYITFYKQTSKRRALPLRIQLRYFKHYIYVLRNFILHA